MATTMTVAEIQQASAMIASGNLAGFYGYMADQGYNYALLAGGLVTGGSFSGEAAVNYLIGSAQAQGVVITPDKLTAIETDMANKWVDALESAAQASPTGTVDGDLTYAQTLAFHTQVFSDFGLGPQTWTLYTPGQVLSPDYMQSSWESMLSQLSTPVTGPMLSEVQLTTDMIEAASNSLNPQSASAALSWLSANAFNVGSDFTAVFEAATPSAQISQVVDGGVQYSEGAGITLTQYQTSSSVNGSPSYSVTKDVWTLPVSSPTISVTDISNGVVVNASTNADVSISNQGIVTVANSNNNIDAGAGTTVVVNSADNNTIVDTSTGQDLTISNGTINLAGISGPVSAGVTDTVIVNSSGAFNVGVQNSSGTQTDYDVFNTTGYLTQDQQFQNGYVYDARNFTDGTLTDVAFYNPSQQITQDQFYTGGASGYVSSAVDYTNGVKTNQAFYNPSEQLTSNNVFNAGGQETDTQYFTGVAGNDLETNQVNYNVADGAEASNYQFNTSGQQTDTQFFTGTATNDYETNQINFSTLNGVETSNFQYNAAGQETDAQVFTGTAGNDIETNQVNFNVANGAETSNYQFNTSGQQTDTQFFTGTATNDYETNQVNYSATNGWETSNVQFNAAGQETDQQNFIGTAGGDYETSQTNFSLSNGAETSNIVFNAQGQETQLDQYAGTSTNNYLDQMDVFTPGATYASQINSYALDGLETMQALYNQTTGRETGYTVFSGTDSDLETGDVQFGSTGNYASQIQLFNSAGKETEDETFNTSTGAVNMVSLFNGVNPYADEEEISSGGQYFSQILNFNPATGQQTGGAEFNAQTGAQTAYFDNGSWYAGDPDDQTDPLDSLFGDDGMSGDDDGGDDGDDGGDDGGDDPLILNLNGGAVQTRSASNSHVTFDMQNNGQKVQTGWGTAGEGYLVYDPNDPGNKTIVNQENQLVSGMGALQSLAQGIDGTGSGTLTASDALWNSLKVWVDTAGTGQFHSGELMSLSQLGITSLSLDGKQVSQSSNGNQIVADSTFTWANGRTGNMAGVNLAFSGGGATGTSAPLTASLVDQQAHLLISSMAAYGAPPAGSSDHVTAVPDLSHHMLAASSH